MSPRFTHDEPVYVIGEAGSNWRVGGSRRDLKMALELIDVAAEAGCDAVKFQTYRAETVYAPGAGTSEYLTASGNPEDIHEIFRDLAMPYEMHEPLAAHARKRGLAFMSTPFSVGDLAAVDPFVEVHKIASYEVNHVRLVAAVAQTKKPVVISSGAAELYEIEAALTILKKNGAGPVCLMQCTSKYPAELDALNLRVIPVLAAKFDVATGLSDHSIQHLIGPVGAVALGARCIEKHYTLNRRLPGPDHPFAIEPDELKAMVQAIREMERALGTDKKEVQATERELRSFAVRSLQALKPIKSGERFIEGESFDILRPGRNKAGINPTKIDDVIGKRATRDIPAGDGIQETDFSTRQP